ncbi:GGDEF domain-containing protein [Pectobacterium betavasculorum]|uniref:GGDEF domain-containing protein n=1 Tax=Pectobacterium betavasculorum TaxID=55207 RepID=UPI00313E4C0B
MEVDVLSHDGVIRTVLLSGVILPHEKAGFAIFKDFSATAPSHRRMREIAHQDDLTGIANRRGLRERWQVEMHSDPESPVAFLMLDLDDFKPVNDHHGHAVGDAVLRVVAKRLADAVRQTDLVCRLGGDEFGILLVAPGDQHRIEMVCNRILQSIAEPINVNGLVVCVQASIGGCRYPDQARDKREMLQRADLALYRGKQVGKKGSWQWFGDALVSTPNS